MSVSLGTAEIIKAKEVGWPEHVACMKNGMAGNFDSNMSSGRIRNGLEDNIKIYFIQCASMRIKLNWITLCVCV